MFDFSRITESLSGLAGDSPANDAALPADALHSMAQAAGLDPALLEGLAPQAIMQRLSEHGIDPSQVSPDQMAEFAQSAGSPQGLADFAFSFLGGHRS